MQSIDWNCVCPVILDLETKLYAFDTQSSILGNQNGILVRTS